MGERPLWRQAYDQFDRTVTPPLERLVRTPQFSAAAARVIGLRAGMHRRLTGATARLWHLVNLPAGTDVQHVRVQIGALDREVRRLALQVAQQEEAAQKGIMHAVTAEPDPGTRSDAPRPGAQRSPRT